MSALKHLKAKAREFKKNIKALYLASRRPDVPLYAKILAMIVVGYALSPIDLIPDFIPILGYLDDMLLIPLGIWLVLKLIPKHVMEECGTQAEDLFKDGKPRNWVAGAIIIFIWVVIVMVIGAKVIGAFLGDRDLYASFL